MPGRRDTAADIMAGFLDQLNALAIRARTEADHFMTASQGVNIPDYATESVGDVTETALAADSAAQCIENLVAPAGTATEGMIAHSELMGGSAGEGVDPPENGEDPGVKQKWYELTVHESGHALYSSLSAHWKPVCMDGLEVTSGGWFREPDCSGYVDSTLRHPERLQSWNRSAWKEVLHDLARLALAGSVAQAYWLNYMNGDDYRKALRGCYEGGGSSDYGKARDVLEADAYPWRLTRAENDTRQFVASHWGQILTMAEAAREQQRLSGRDIERLAAQLPGDRGKS